MSNHLGYESGDPAGNGKTLKSVQIGPGVFTCPVDFNAQLGQRLPKANARLVMRTSAGPADLHAADKAAMLALPPVTGSAIAYRWLG